MRCDADDLLDDRDGIGRGERNPEARDGEPECGESIECGRGDAAAPALSPSPGLCAALLPYDGVRGLPIASAAEFGAGLGGNAGVYGPGVGMGVVCGEKVPLRGVPAYEP